jgi:hypothetical protein
MADEYDVSAIPFAEEKPQQPALDMSKSVMSPDYRSRTAFGAQELGGGQVAQTLAGLGGGLAGAGLVRPKAIGLSTQQLQNANRDETLKLFKDFSLPLSKSVSMRVFLFSTYLPE